MSRERLFILLFDPLFDETHTTKVKVKTLKLTTDKLACSQQVPVPSHDTVHTKRPNDHVVQCTSTSFEVICLVHAFTCECTAMITECGSFPVNSSDLQSRAPRPYVIL